MSWGIRFHLQVARGTLVRLLHRTVDAAAPAYAMLLAQLGRSPVVTPDEGGWRVKQGPLAVGRMPAGGDGLRHLQGAGVRRRRFSAPTSPAGWCETGGLTAASRRCCTRRAWCTCTAGRPAVRTAPSRADPRERGPMLRAPGLVASEALRWRRHPDRGRRHSSASLSRPRQPGKTSCVHAANRHPQSTICASAAPLPPQFSTARSIRLQFHRRESVPSSRIRVGEGDVGR